MQVNLSSGEIKQLPLVIIPEEYLNHLTSFNTMLIETVAWIEKRMSLSTISVALKSPRLEIRAPSSVNLNQTFTIVVRFKNPLNELLQNCFYVVEAKGFSQKSVRVDDVAPLSLAQQTLEMRTYYDNVDTFIVKFQSSQLRDVTGNFKLNINGGYNRTRLFGAYTQYLIGVILSLHKIEICSVHKSFFQLITCHIEGTHSLLHSFETSKYVIDFSSALYGFSTFFHRSLCVEN
ncbi:protein-glutamine gamma-glutamyltransferase 2-like protein [Leptotrombidium deliense]|uniref:Protein-glutamine gamma-glutamyltransferase 2-like protein n=1 Tax=Leptotrombidium deliense TaxID=299467 RepID=A0A443RYI3_9ACAR|nr:protein-glutamine gamma-glutamyltransferase 2-like protein [Leptotrombidium deliense]